MALIACPECKKKISETVDSCPHCGYKLTHEMIEQIKKESLLYGGIAFLVIFVFVIITIILFVASREDRRSTRHITYTQPSVEIGHSYSLKMTCYGASSAAALDRVFEVVKSGDQEAITKMRLSGQLIHLEQGRRVTVVDLTIFGKAEVRLEGEYQTIWIFSDWLE